jgi:hypothetical protein
MRNRGAVAAASGAGEDAGVLDDTPETG